MNALAIEDLLHPWLGRYLAAPGWIKSTVGRAYAALPAGVRYGAAYREFETALARTSDAEAAERYAMQKLEETLAWAIETVPAYRAYGHLRGRPPEEALRALPVTDKLAIKRDPGRYLSQAVTGAMALETFTGGSTSTPMQFWLHKHVTRPKEFAFMRDFRRRVGAHDDAGTVLALRGRLVEAAASGGAPWTYEPIRRQLMLSCDHLSRAYMPAFAQALARYRPAFIEAFPSALFPLARWLEEHPLPEFTRGVKGVMLFSENVYGFQMQAFRRVFDAPIVAHYGHSERVLMAATRPDDERYSFWPQYGWLELVDGRGRPITQPGRLGYVVGTSFDNLVMPFVRYRTGDLAMLAPSADSRPGRFPAIERIAGRLQEFIVCRDARRVSITALGTGHFPELCAVDSMQYEQERPGELVLKVVAAAKLGPADARRIAAAVEGRLQGACRVTVAQVERIERTPRGKARMLVQHLDLRRRFDAREGRRLDVVEECLA